MTGNKRSIRLLPLLLALILLTTLAASARGDTDFNHDINNDGHVDAVHRKHNGIAIWNVGWKNGYRVVSMTGSSIDPHWNKQSNGKEMLRIFSSTQGVYGALAKSGIYVDPNSIYPSHIWSAFYLLDNGGSITNVAPKDSGMMTVTPFAKALVTLSELSGGPQAVADYLFDFISASGGYLLQDQEKNNANEYAHTYSYYRDRYDWMKKTAGKTDLPSNICTCDAHRSAYQDYGIAHTYSYEDQFWVHGSQHPVQLAAKVEYWMLKGQSWYAFDSGWIYQGYFAYGGG